jgi:hypothetical protein
VRTIALIGAVAVLVAGCGSSDGEGGDSTIVYERGGGMTGAFIGVEIEPDGEATLTTAELGKEKVRSFEVADAELEAIRAHLDEADVGSLGENVTDDCMDCFGYTLTYDGERASADSSTLSDDFIEAAQPLVDLTADMVPEDMEGG